MTTLRCSQMNELGLLFSEHTYSIKDPSLAWV